ncbi:MAG: GlmU family protein [Hymenobacteraceae bacterium]|nr:GlmU family protein [Hymenobacteraceae bacterium]
MHLILFDDPAIRQQLLPFSFTRPVAGVRCGTLTLAEKWQQRGHAVSYLTQPYLAAKFAADPAAMLYVNGAVCADDALDAALHTLVPGGALRLPDETLVAFRAEAPLSSVEALLFAAQEATVVTHASAATIIRQSWHLFKLNGAQLRADFALLTAGRKSERITDPHTIVYAPENVFLEPGVKIRAAILNAEAGPIYLGRNAQVQEGAVIVGPCSIGDNSTVNVGAKLRGDNTVGPHCKVGGEISNSILFGYSNKGHDGFLGNSVLGEWCNLGADTNTSNLKNNYAPVKVWSYAKQGFVNTGEQFCGLLMGDHAKAGINTMFNTGTVVGVGANVFGAGYPRTFIPAFAWGGAQGFDTFKLPQMLEVAQRVMERRKIALDTTEKKLLEEVYELTKAERVWEKT